MLFRSREGGVFRTTTEAAGVDDARTFEISRLTEAAILALSLSSVEASALAGLRSRFSVYSTSSLMLNCFAVAAWARIDGAPPARRRPR